MCQLRVDELVGPQGSSEFLLPQARKLRPPDRKAATCPRLHRECGAERGLNPALPGPGLPISLPPCLPIG